MNDDALRGTGRSSRPTRRPTSDDAGWTVLQNRDSHIVRWRRCLADDVVKIQCWSTNPSYGERGVVTLDIGSADLRAIVAALAERTVARILRAPSKRRASAKAARGARPSRRQRP